MRRQEKHDRKQRITPSHRHAETLGTGRFRIPRGKGGIILLLLVMLGSYYIHDYPPRSAEKEPTTSSMILPVQQTGNADGDDAEKLTSLLFATVQETWQSLFKQAGKTWQPARLIMYRGATRNDCSGDKTPGRSFYCPASATVYIDLDFYDQQREQPVGDGDFALGYLVAQQAGWHIQHLLGIDTVLANSLTLNDPAQRALILQQGVWQRDCFAGIWANAMEQRNLIKPDDINNVIRIVSTWHNEDSFAETSPGIKSGASPSENQWFFRGYQGGDPGQCDSFHSK